MKKAITVLVLVLGLNNLYSQKVNYTEDGNKVIVSANEVIKMVSFRSDKGLAYFNYEDSQRFEVNRTMIVIELKELKEDACEVVVEMATSIVVIKL